MSVRDSVTGRQRIVQTADPGSETWPWALCHSGAWVHLRGRATAYTFVVGKKRHHPPVRWLRAGKQDAYVPRHPSDVQGRPPLNLKYGVFVATHRESGTFEHVDYKPTEKYTVLNQAPKAFRDVRYPQLASAERPVIKGRLMAYGTRPASPISFDYKTRQFLQGGSLAAGRMSKPMVVGGLGAHGGSSTGSGRSSGGGGGDHGGGGGGSRSGGAEGGGAGGGGAKGH
jgi:hypothetical protein